MFEWVIQVLRAQGCPSSMNWFSFAIDPLLLFLERRLDGIPIHSLPVLGPVEKKKPRLPPLTVEHFKVLGLADDIKPSVMSMAEFEVVERGATLFEWSTGNQLHRDPVKGKCKALLLGRWKGVLQQEDIGYPHFRITDSLAFIGVRLTASWQRTRKENNDELLDRVKSTIGAWKAGKFLPLICRPFSVNSYCLSRIWFCTHTVDLRVGDIESITSTVKQYIYRDMLEKPGELLLYRPTDQGGLGLHNIRCKALASRITTFLQTAANPRFQQSAYYSALYHYHCLNDDIFGKPAPPPYYDAAFFEQIKKAMDKSHVNPIQMSLKQWYSYLLEEEVTMQEEFVAGPMVSKLSRIEALSPTTDWQKIYFLSRQKGLSPDIKSFNFKLINSLLPFKQRVSNLLPNSLPQCTLCPGRPAPGPAPHESPQHAYFECEWNREAGVALLSLVRVFDSTITEDKLLKLDVSTTDIYEQPCILLLSCGLELIWRNRVNKKKTSVQSLRAEIMCTVSLLRDVKARRLRECGRMIKNHIENFLVL